MKELYKQKADSGSNWTPRILYIVYWGGLEPLGRSLVVPAVEELASLGAKIDLVTFDKPEHLAGRDDANALRKSLKGRAIRWISLRYHKNPKIPATMVDIINGFVRGLSLGLRRRPDVVHARTFIGGLIGLCVSAVLRTKLVYHNEGFYPDEQVDGGVWAAGSAPHRLARWLEGQMYAKADGVIVLSNRAKAVIENLPAVNRKRTPIITVPSCVDMAHFVADLPKRAPSKEPAQQGLRLIYIGSVGGRYHLDKIGRFAAVASQLLDGVTLRILTKAEPDLVASMLDMGGLKRESWSLDCVSRKEMPNELACADAGLFFLSSGISEHGCSPTKVGEYWAMGLPVVTTHNVSDNDEIIKSESVGVILADHSDQSYEQAVEELLLLLRDPQTPERCRLAAERHYSLAPACRRQAALYDTILTTPVSREHFTSGARLGDSRAHTPKGLK